MREDTHQQGLVFSHPNHNHLRIQNQTVKIDHRLVSCGPCYIRAPPSVKFASGVVVANHTQSGANAKKLDAKLAALVALLALLGPVACHGASIICQGGWVRPVPSLLGGGLVCPGNLTSYPLKKSPAPSATALKVGLIRLFFHDCFVRGCDASVLLRNTSCSSDPTEMFGLPNINSLRGFEVIDAAKAALEAACPGVVSCADTLAFAARDASSVLSGGRISSFAMPAGRHDGRVSLANETTDNLPGPFCDLDALNNFFAAKGLDTNDMVTLSGAHTIGQARCAFVSNRTDMNATLAKDLKDKCRSGGNTKVALDYKTPDTMDVQYYQNVNDDDVVLDSDAALSSPQTKPLVDTYAAGSSGNLWETKFAAAMVKMGSIEVKTSPGADAEIRMKCSIYN
ncbi:peroxidase 2-like [Miscanthus floridulus]|uniref:peroxidase 2-like n=1 Tax=Miscanthus floridulus TaxID=154761 RepID=UPI0034596CA3